MKTAVILVIVYAILVLAISTIPGSKLPHTDLMTKDKFLHLCEYLILGILLANALRWKIDSMWAVFGISILAAMLFGAADEFYQSFIPGRDSSFNDAVADTIGATLGSMTFILWNNRRAQKTPH